MTKRHIYVILFTDNYSVSVFVFTIGSARATVSYYRYAPFVTYVCSAARLIESRKYAFGREDFQMRKVRITALLVSAVIMISLLPKVLFASNNSEEKLYSGIKNIIFMIGDGMGPNQVASARERLNAPLSMEGMSVSGTVCTDNVLGELTDSAAAGTALSTGVKTKNGTVAKDKNGNELQTMLEYFAERNKLTGLVTTSFFSDATPAAFGAHVDDRSETAKIAKGFIDNGINVLMGGGTSKFSYALMSYAKRNGYEYVTDRNTLLGFDGEKLIGLFASNYMSYENDRPSTEPSIAEMTEKAIDLLSGNEDGFFLMVEAGNIDHAGHSNLLESSIADTIAFSEAVQVALDFLEENPDTLIVVTADHETGGLTKENGTYIYTTTNHSQAKVPYYVAGKGSDYFENLTDNTQISLKLRQAATELDAQWIADNGGGEEPTAPTTVPTEEPPTEPTEEPATVPTEESTTDPAEPSTGAEPDPTEDPTAEPVTDGSDPETSDSAMPISAILLLGTACLGIACVLKKKAAK